MLLALAGPQLSIMGQIVWNINPWFSFLGIIVPLILGIIAWRSPAGKAAVVTSTFILLVTGPQLVGMAKMHRDIGRFPGIVKQPPPILIPSEPVMVEAAPIIAVGLDLAWSREGHWSGVAGPTGPTALYALEEIGRLVRLNEKGADLGATTIDDSSRSIRTANLAPGGKCALLTFRIWGPTVKAYSGDGKPLWSYAGGDAVDDVWAADLNGDGLDEVIIGYNGGTGLHVLDNTGKLLWKNTDVANVWHVDAGNVDGDAWPAVVTTSADGKVHIFNAKGEHLRNLEPGFYGNMVRTWQQPGVDKPLRLIIVAGTSGAKTTVAAINPQGETRWSLELSARVGNAVTCRQRPWLALTLADGSVRVINVVAGKEIAHVGGQGDLTDVAWLPAKNRDPLLVIATRVELAAYRITAAKR